MRKHELFYNEKLVYVMYAETIEEFKAHMPIFIVENDVKLKIKVSGKNEYAISGVDLVLYTKHKVQIEFEEVE